MDKLEQFNSSSGIEEIMDRFSLYKENSTELRELIQHYGDVAEALGLFAVMKDYDEPTISAFIRTAIARHNSTLTEEGMSAPLQDVHRYPSLDLALLAERQRQAAEISQALGESALTDCHRSPTVDRERLAKRVQQSDAINQVMAERGSPLQEHHHSLVPNPERIAERARQRDAINQSMFERGSPLQEYHHSLQPNPERVAERRRQNTKILGRIRDRSIGSDREGSAGDIEIPKDE